jgi:hypothetical protein
MSLCFLAYGLIVFFVASWLIPGLAPTHANDEKGYTNACKQKRLQRLVGIEVCIKKENLPDWEYQPVNASLANKRCRKSLFEDD